MKKKIALTITSIALVAALAVGGTLAYLSQSSKTVTNTFIAGNSALSLTLDESKLNEDGTLDTATRVQGNEYALIPSATYEKDPRVQVTTGDNESYLFVKVTKTGDFDTYIDAAVAEGWTPLAGVDGVYYQTVPANTENGEYYILAGGTTGQVTVKNLAANEMPEANTKMELIFNAYTIQTATFADAAAAWDAVKDMTPAE